MNVNGGWTKTPNEIFAAIPAMGTPELLCTLVLVRETAAYHRRQARLTYAGFMRATGIKSRAALAAGLRAVEARGFFRRTAVGWWQLPASSTN